ncbi:MAG: SdpI family protein [Candidatus Acidiferrales bacterium]
MDINLALVAYILPGMAVVFGLPMALGLVPPNRFYGFRTRKTLSSPEVWYPANQVCGWAMVVAGTVAILHNSHFHHQHADWPSTTQQISLSLSTGFLLLLAVAISALYLRKL